MKSTFGKIGRYLFLVTITALFLCACRSDATNNFAPLTSSIFVKKDGSFQSALVKSLAGKQGLAYTADGLKAAAQTEVDSFNASAGAEKVTIEKTDMSNNNLSIYFSYSDSQALIDWAKYSQDSLILESLMVENAMDAQSSGKLNGMTFVKPDNSEVEFGSLSGIKKASAAIIRGSATFSFEGTVIAYSRGVSKTGDNAYMTAEGNNCIVFR